MQNQEDRLEIDATHLTDAQVCELLKDVMKAVSECVKMGHSAYIRRISSQDVHPKSTSQT